MTKLKFQPIYRNFALPNGKNHCLNMEKSTKKMDWKKWLQKIGVAGFLFFFIKGLAWIAVFMGLGKAVCN